MAYNNVSGITDLFMHTLLRYQVYQTPKIPAYPVHPQFLRLSHGRRSSRRILWQPRFTRRRDRISKGHGRNWQHCPADPGHVQRLQ